MRCSQTSGSVLQTALCYVEAIRAKSQSLYAKSKQAPEPLPERKIKMVPLVRFSMGLNPLQMM